LLAAIAVFYIPIDVRGQENEPNAYPKYGAKISIYYTRQFSNNDFTIGTISPSFSVRTKRNNFHEFELNQLSFTKTEGGITTSYQQNFGIQYQFIYLLIRDGYHRINPFMASSVGFDFFRSRIEPKTSATFAASNTNYVIIVDIILGASFRIVRSFYVELSLPTDFFFHGGQFQNYQNPTLSPHQQKTGGYDNEIFPLNVFQVKFSGGFFFGN